MIDKSKKVVCHTPTPGKQPTRIAKWKYELMRNTILSVVAKDEEGVPFDQLSRLVRDKLSEQEQEKVGSIPWYTTVVKLDMEVKKEIARVPGSSPQRLIKLK
jgi:hypothetical protein